MQIRCMSLDVIYSRIINCIYKLMNISVNIKQNFFKLCMSVAIYYRCTQRLSYFVTIWSVLE